MAKILSGLPVQEKIAAELKTRFSRLPFKPNLVVVSLGEHVDSESYIRAKKNFAEKIGVVLTRERLSAMADISELKALISKLNANSSVHGIIVQLPLPRGFETAAVLDEVSPCKDVDALSSYWLRRFFGGEKGSLMPATARGVLSLLDYYNIKAAGKRVVVIGRSPFVGKTVAEALLKRDATVTICHRKTPDLPVITRTADILVSAAGVPALIRKEHVVMGQTVIDIGISSVGTGVDSKKTPRRIQGDVDFEAVKDIVGAISPVPGGVGPLTVASLFENLAELMDNANSKFQ